MLHTERQHKMKSEAPIQDIVRLATAQLERKETRNSERTLKKEGIEYHREAPGHIIQSVRPLVCCRNEGSTGCLTAPSAFRTTPNRRELQHTSVHGNGRTTRQHSTAVAGSSCHPADGKGRLNAHTDTRMNPQASETANAEAKRRSIKLWLAMACMGSMGINVAQEASNQLLAYLRSITGPAQRHTCGQHELCRGTLGKVLAHSVSMYASEAIHVEA